MKILASLRVVLENDVRPAILVLHDGTVIDIIDWTDTELQEQQRKYPNADVYDFGDKIIMPGIVDSHVHVNEPGRTEWEGFYTATRAAAAGGVTTIVDMPLNSIPPTTTLANLRTKARAARAQTYVDVGFWGGVIPGNQKDLKDLVNAGVVGFKCFLCPSGVDEFPHVNENDLETALSELKLIPPVVLAFHAELDNGNSAVKGNPCNYQTFLDTRPQSMEVSAIETVVNLCRKHEYPCHIVHLSSSEALPAIKKAKEQELPLTVETCYHYLCLSAEKIPSSATQFKCCPPIREQDNQKKLWAALKDGTIDMIVSDHSPCTEDLKHGGDFLRAWGGISSLQFGLALMSPRLPHIQQIARLMCREPARLCGFDRKGRIFIGGDADLVVWDPDAPVKIQKHTILHKNKLTPYLGEQLEGKVIATLVRGRFAYKDGKLSDEPAGKLLLKDDFLATL